MSNNFEIDDIKLIEKFVQGSNQLIAITNLRLEVNGTVSQLMSRSGDTTAFMYLQSKPRTIIIKNNPDILAIINPLLLDRDFVGRLQAVVPANLLDRRSCKRRSRLGRNTQSNT